MPRKSTTFQIEGYDKQFVVNELTIRQVIDLAKRDFQDTSIVGLKSQFESFLPLASNVTLNELYEMTPSEIKLIWGKFKEVNSAFFEIAQQIGVEDLLGELKKAITADFGRLLVSSLSQDT